MSMHKTPEEKQQVTTNEMGVKETTLIGQSGYSPDAQAFMLKGNDLMCIDTGPDGPVYLSREQAKEMFGLTEPLI